MALDYFFEAGFIIFLVFGVIISFVLNNVILQGTTIFVFGIFATTARHLKKRDTGFPYWLLIIGFLLGYLVATKTGFRLFFLILFIVGAICGKIIKKHFLTKK